MLSSSAPLPFMDTTLTRTQARVFFVLAALLFVLPFILADFPYVDDNWRAQLDVQEAWRYEGRVLSELFYRVMTFSGVTLNIFPLPLLLAVVSIAWAMAALTRHYFPAPKPVHCLVVLPLWFCPFYLGNLTYQYDGPTMTFSLVAAVYAIVYRSPYRLAAVVVPGVLLAVAFAFYQVAINVFVGLCCIEWVRAVWEKQRCQDMGALLIRQVLQLFTGLLLYYATAYQFMGGERQGLLKLDANGLCELVHRAGLVVDTIGLFITPGNAWVWSALALLAVIGFVMGAVALLRERRIAALGMLLVYLASVPVLAVSIPGMLLPFADFTLEARTLMGFAPVLVLLSWLAYQMLAQVHRRLGLVLLVPLLCMLSLSYVYGRVLVAQKAFEQTLTRDLHYDLTSNPALRGLKQFYWNGGDSTGTWLPPMAGTLQNMPALAFIMGLTPYNFAVVEHMSELPIEGDDDFIGRLLIHGAGTKVVENRFYDIWVVNGYGYVAMKHAPH